MPFKFRLVMIRNDWKKIGPNTAAKLMKLIDDYGIRVVDNTRLNIIRHGLIKTGFMLDSVVWYPYPSRKGGAIIIGADYAIFHEYGTIYVMRKPFFGPALEEAYVWWERELRQIMESPLREM